MGSKRGCRGPLEVLCNSKKGGDQGHGEREREEKERIRERERNRAGSREKEKEKERNRVPKAVFELRGETTSFHLK